MMRATEIMMLIVCIYLLFCSCNPSFPRDMTWIRQSSGVLQKDVLIDSFLFTFKLTPTSYLLQKEGLVGEQKIEERRVELDSMLWLNVTISINGFNQSPLRYKLSGPGEYEGRLDYYLNRAASDFNLVVGGMDTLFPTAYWFENNQNLIPAETMIIGFQRPSGLDVSKALQLSYFDRIFGNGIIKTIIRGKTLEEYLVP